MRVNIQEIRGVLCDLEETLAIVEDELKTKEDERARYMAEPHPNAVWLATNTTEIEALVLEQREMQERVELTTSVLDTRVKHQRAVLPLTVKKGFHVRFHDSSKGGASGDLECIAEKKEETKRALANFELVLDLIEMDIEEKRAERAAFRDDEHCCPEKVVQNTCRLVKLLHRRNVVTEQVREARREIKDLNENRQTEKRRLRGDPRSKKQRRASIFCK